jgi:hypothetical protein
MTWNSQVLPKEGEIELKAKYSAITALVPHGQCGGEKTSSERFHRHEPHHSERGWLLICIDANCLYCVPSVAPPPPRFHEAENTFWLAEGDAERIGSTPASMVTAVAALDVPCVATIITASPL